MNKMSYIEFIQEVEKLKVLPFSNCLADYPSLAELAKNNDWHTDSATDPWQWRVKIVHDGIAAYGKFFNDKPWFIHINFFPYIYELLSLGKTIEERYNDGLISRSAYRLYEVIIENSEIDSRELRKKAGLQAKENKKEYEHALIELQNFGDIVITGAVKQNEEGTGWSSMCYKPTLHWLESVHYEPINLDTIEFKQHVRSQLIHHNSKKQDAFFIKKLGL